MLNGPFTTIICLSQELVRPKMLHHCWLVNLQPMSAFFPFLTLCLVCYTMKPSLNWMMKLPEILCQSTNITIGNVRIINSNFVLVHNLFNLNHCNTINLTRTYNWYCSLIIKLFWYTRNLSHPNTIFGMALTGSVGPANHKSIQDSVVQST